MRLLFLPSGYPQLSVEPIILKENETLNSTCCITTSTSTNLITISWLLGERPLLQLNRTTHRKIKNGLVKYCSSVLEILASRYIHGKTLTCMVVKKHISASHVVNVLYPCTVRVSTKQSLKIYNNERDVFIECEANGNPQPQVLLQKKDENGQWNALEIGYMKSIKENITWTFHFGNASDDIKGMYRCIAFNDVGLAAVSKTVEIEYYNSKKRVSTILVILAVLVIAVLVLIRIIKRSKESKGCYCFQTKILEDSRTTVVRFR
ncbi:Neurofascin [Holothuria leucospilota]|uniref:Neurofascin n=1 Tax=Holothuria leucospilota TaxID=206669 RepID=A0A9Q0YNR4_HOLLE|nr:Neurofascin [Holothuria leucospilota]